MSHKDQYCSGREALALIKECSRQDWDFQVSDFDSSTLRITARRCLVKMKTLLEDPTRIMLDL